MSLFFRSPIPTATGGTIANFETPPYNKIHTFTGNGSFTPTVDTFIDVLAIGGGGTGGSSGSPGNNGGGGGGGAAIIYRKFLKVSGSTPYPINIGGVGAASQVIFGTTTITAPAGGAGANVLSTSGYSGSPAPLASGGGSGGWNSASGGTGAGVYGVGFPGFLNSPAGSGSAGSGGGGAGSGGPESTAGSQGGTGVPIAYFTNNPTDIVCYGGPGGKTGNSQNRPATAYGSGAGGSPSVTPGFPGVVYIKY